LRDAIAQSHNRTDLVDRRDAHLDRLNALYRGQSYARPLFLWGYQGKGKTDPYDEPERWLVEALGDLADHVDLLNDDVVFRPLVIEFGPYGVHFVDRILGAHVFDLDGEGNWQAQTLDRPVGTLCAPDLETDTIWALARCTALAFIASDVSVPFFGLPTIASVLNVAVNLYGQEILLAMLTNPPAAHHDLRIINDLLCDLHRWYLACIPSRQLQPVVASMRTQPPGFGQLCGCTTHLLSAELYCEFVAPLDAELLAVYPYGGMIHLCGEHTQHIATWREMGACRAVQINDRAADDLESYWQGLRKDQIIYVNAYDDMPVERILDITGGRRVVIVADPRL